MLSLGKASYRRNISPTGALADFREVWRAAGGRRWPFVALAMTTTIAIFSVIVQESWKGPPHKREVVFINSWPADRPDAQIEREIIANQKLQDRLAAEQAVREEKVRQIYRTLGRVSGMDVGAIEKQARADEAAQAKSAGSAGASRASGTTIAGPRNSDQHESNRVAKP